MQALVLAAGMGSRLKSHTEDKPKCMVEINGKTLIERLLMQLDKYDLSKIIIVDGYRSSQLEKYIASLDIHTQVEYITNSDYSKTNNIYSVYLARDLMIEEDTIMVESDLVLSDEMVEKIMLSQMENFAVVSKYQNWMDGTVVKYNEYNQIVDFISKNEFDFKEISQYYKTVNIYRFSKDFSEKYYFPFLEAQMRAFGMNEYYETVLRTIVSLDSSLLQAYDIGDSIWYEVDDAQDLSIANTIFETSPTKKFERINSSYGGYWRFPELLDYCYLVNPTFPPQRMLDEISSNIKRLIIDYPSGLDVNISLIAKYYNVDSQNVTVGNGAAELIKSLLSYLPGKYGIIAPTFEEYPNRLTPERIVKFYPNDENFSYTVEDIKLYFNNKEIQNLVLINPDNPTGNYIPKQDILGLLNWCENKEINLILDESFGDFVNIETSGTLIDNQLLENHPRLILIKSISKSFGVPGVRLGFLMTGDKDIIDYIKKDLSIWNINSFGEFFLQIFEKYKKDYDMALDEFYKIRKKMLRDLENMNNLTVYSSQANYFMCKIEHKYISSKELAELLLSNDQILIKDLSVKDGFKQENYIRLAIKTEEENNYLVQAMKKYLGE